MIEINGLKDEVFIYDCNKCKIFIKGIGIIKSRQVQGNKHSELL